MGSGIAQACAVKGIRVILIDISQAAVDKAMIWSLPRLR